MTSKKECVIQDWAIQVDPFGKADPYTAPELIPSVLTGKVFGHERIEDGHNIISSPIVKVDIENGIVETMNTVYRVGKKAEDYQLYCNEYNSEV